MQLVLAETDTYDTGGVIITIDSGFMLSIAWRTQVPIEPTLEAAKQYASQIIQTLIDKRRMSDVEATNWASATAAIQKCLQDWNDKLREHHRSHPISASGTVQ